MDTPATTLASGGFNIGSVFRWVYIPATTGILITLWSLFMMEERPLRTRVHTAPVVVE